MNPLLEEIFATRKFITSENQIVDIHSETSREQCEFLQRIIRDNHFNRSVEVGFAYGMSTLAIIEEVSKNGGKHLVMDIGQNDYWGGHGIDLIRQAGYSDKLDFFEEYSYKILFNLLAQGRKFDFAYIDSTKQFDWLLVDFFLLDKLLDTNGVIVFDDVMYPGIRKLVRYLSQFPNYEVYGQCPPNMAPTASRKIAGWLKILPGSGKILKDELQKTDYELGINSQCVALKKTGEDKRNWDWHISF